MKKVIRHLWIFLLFLSVPFSLVHSAEEDAELLRIEEPGFDDEDFDEEEETGGEDSEDIEKELIDDEEDLERELIEEDEELEAELLEEEEEEQKEEPQVKEPESSLEKPSLELPSEEEEGTGADEAKIFQEEIEEFDVEEGEGETPNEGGVASEGEVPEPEAPGLTEPPVEELESVEESVGQDVNVITNISYLSENDEIMIEGSQAISYQHKQNEENGQLIIEILEAKLEDNLKWPYVLRDFNTGFGLIQADQKEEGMVRVLIQLKEKTTFPSIRMDETGQKLFVYFADGRSSKDSSSGSEGGQKSSSKVTAKTLPPLTLEDLYSGNITFSGSPISFHVIDAPIKQVLRFISEESGLNMVIDDKVGGNVTLKLESIPWDQALYTIFKVKNLGYTREGNVVTISPLETIDARIKKIKEISDRQKPLAPFQTKVIPVSYGKISEMEAKVKEFLTKEDAQKGQKGGKVIAHAESNTLIVIDTEKVIKRVSTLVSHLDKTPSQVMVEARIVEAEETLSRNFGLTWGVNGNFPIVPVTLSTEGIRRAIQGISGNYVGTAGNEGRFTINLSGIPIIGDVGASLNLAEINGYARVVSSPKIVTISGKQASITRNSPIQIRKTETVTQTAGGDQSTNTNFENIDVEIKLDVTPTVTSARTVFLKVDISRSNPGAGRTVQTTRKATTEVLVKDGHTIVIGGIYQYDHGHKTEGIPFLNKIPFLKYFLDQRESSSGKNELLVFLTPKIVNIND